MLEVNGYDIILGADWIYNHSPVGLDLKRRDFSITGAGNQIITFSDEIAFHGQQLIGTKKLCNLVKKKAIGAIIVLNNSNTTPIEQKQDIPPEIQAVLAEFADIFQEPDQLPPYRSVDHSIPLVDEAKKVNQRPYRLPYHQKNAMEALVKQMLQA